MFEIIFKKMFIVLLASIVNASTHTKCMSLSSQKFEIQPALINFYPNEYNQGFHYCPITINLNRCLGSCNTLHDLSNNICIPHKTEDLNLSKCVFNIITGINESKRKKA